MNVVKYDRRFIKQNESTMKDEEEIRISLLINYFKQKIMEWMERK